MDEYRNREIKLFAYAQEEVFFNHQAVCLTVTLGLWWASPCLFRPQLDSATDFEERRMIRAALRDLLKKKSGKSQFLLPLKLWLHTVLKMSSLSPGCSSVCLQINVSRSEGPGSRTWRIRAWVAEEPRVWALAEPPWTSRHQQRVRSRTRSLTWCHILTLYSNPVASLTIWLCASRSELPSQTSPSAGGWVSSIWFSCLGLFIMQTWF